MAVAIGDVVRVQVRRAAGRDGWSTPHGAKPVLGGRAPSDTGLDDAVSDYVLEDQMARELIERTSALVAWSAQQMRNGAA